MISASPVGGRKRGRTPPVNFPLCASSDLLLDAGRRRLQREDVPPPSSASPPGMFLALVLLQHNADVAAPPVAARDGLITERAVGAGPHSSAVPTRDRINDRILVRGMWTVGLSVMAKMGRAVKAPSDGLCRDGDWPGRVMWWAQAVRHHSLPSLIGWILPDQYGIRNDMPDAPEICRTKVYV